MKNNFFACTTYSTGVKAGKKGKPRPLLSIKPGIDDGKRRWEATEQRKLRRMRGVRGTETQRPKGFFL
ncbi:MAG: hypothetical protein EX330_11265 [Candidatus Brocadia sp. BROELEC01]|nr:hypothetical protein [Candidatus Brocadia sapporoensis]QQR66501.1 MAG: hypothetical protein IPI25_13495 [Candidatus Brocadia sp.]RZV57049.1 MAG: hypothetical protein EX330_11240 [Candidatus Brocadia sp. BROELEC01]RZV57052.1 MAG: hypothetical protein EX330_11265 [Candidatus Brocadia sp. BROELEC01]